MAEEPSSDLPAPISSSFSFPDERAPDYITPTLAWRSWLLRFTPSGIKGPYLCSVTAARQVTWKYRQKLTAGCHRGELGPIRHVGWGGYNVSECAPADTIPSARCSCGIYGGDSLFRALSYTRVPRTGLSVIGIVSLWGRIIEHEQGWRAQYAYPKLLIVIPPATFTHLAMFRGTRPVVPASEALATAGMMLSDLYGVPCLIAPHTYSGLLDNVGFTSWKQQNMKLTPEQFILLEQARQSEREREHEVDTTSHGGIADVEGLFRKAGSKNTKAEKKPQGNEDWDKDGYVW